MTQPPRPGRPPSGINAEGNPEKTSEYPKLTIAMRPEAKARLDAASTLVKLPAWRIIDAALDRYIETLPGEDRCLIDSMANRMMTPDGRTIRFARRIIENRKDSGN